MAAGAVYRYVPYSGYPQALHTACGAPLTTVVDATRPAALLKLWGMTLLERTVRTVERLGGRQIHLLVRPGQEALARRRRFPGASTPAVHAVDGNPAAAAAALLRDVTGPVLLLEGDGLYDRRLLARLWQTPAPAVGTGAGGDLEAAALMATAPWLHSLPLERFDTLAAAARFCARMEAVQRVDTAQLESRVSLLRKTVPVRVLRVASPGDLRRADDHLKALAGKGVNDLVGEFVHPPIEFALTRLAARTPITPDLVSYAIILLSLAGLWCFATGRWWEGVAVNLVRGMLDGVDGKLARLTLRETRRGNVLDHGTDTAYLPLLFLALGWRLSGGDPTSPPALATYLLQGFYWLNRLLASWFKTFLGADESEFRPIDRVVRRFQPKRNICILIMIVALLADSPAGGLYAITALTALFALYRMARLNMEGRRRTQHRSQAAAPAA